jgi:hypothetical protein
VHFNASTLVGGVYNGSLLLRHNAPGTITPIAVPCTLTVNGFRRLSASPTAINFDLTRVGLRDTAFITLINAGSEAVQVASFSISNPVFTSTVAPSFIVQAFDSVRIPLLFSPPAAGNHSGTLSITSNAQDNPSITVPLSGTGVPGPSIAVTPQQVTLRLASGESAVRTVSISNTGGADLVWNINNGSGGIVSRETHDTIPGVQSRIYSATHDLTCDYWSDAGNDAFDGFGTPSVTVGGISSRVCMLEGDSSYTINGYRIRVRNDFAENHIYRSIIEPQAGESSSRSDITVNLTGNMGSDGSETVYRDSVLVAGTWLRFYVNEVSFPNSDPRVIFLIVPSRMGQRDSVRYWQPSSGYVSMEARNISLPATVYVIPSYHSLAAIKTWFQNDLIMRNNWLSVAPGSGTTPAGQVSNLQFSFVTTGMSEGTYFDTIRIMHNASVPASPVSIPVVLTVNNNGVVVSSRIELIGPSVTPTALGTRFSIQKLTVGSAITGKVVGTRHKAILQ